MNRFLCLISVLAFTIKASAQGVPISPVVMSQSYWWTDWYDGFGNNQSTLGNAWPNVKSSGVTLCRAGGKGYNVGNEKPQGGQEVYYVSMVVDIRKNGCEPVLTLPFLLTTYTTISPEPNAGDPLFTAAVAASIKTLQTILRQTNEVHQRNIRYVILGNEPDLDYWWTTDWPTLQQDPGSEKAQHTQTCSLNPKCGATDAQTVALNIANYIKPMANAVRAMEQEMGFLK